MNLIRFSPMLVLFAALLTLLVGAPAPTLAQAPTGGTFELFAGWLWPEESLIDDDVVFGLRGGYRFSGSAGFEGSLSYFNADTFGLGIDFYFFDASFKWYPGSGSSGNELVLFGGPGWATVEVDAGGLFSATADSFSAHVGVAAELSLSQNVYLRPDARARWLEDSEDVDLEASLAVGFRF